MPKIKPLVAFLILSTAIPSLPIYSQSANEARAAQGPNAIVDEAPFAPQLEFYYTRSRRNENVFFLSAVTFFASFLIGTVANTGSGLGLIDPSAGTTAATISTGISVLSATTGVVSFLRWKEARDNYQDTVRLQTDYYAIIRGDSFDD